MHLTKLLQNVEELLRPEQPLTEGDSITLRDILDQLHRKESLIAALDAKILESLVDVGEVEAKVLQAEEVHSLISMAKTKITHRLTPLAIPTSTHPHGPHRSEPRKSSDNATRLPKLNLPHFSQCTGSPSGILSKPQ